MIRFRMKFVKRITSYVLSTAFIFALFFSPEQVYAKQTAVESRNINVLVVGIDPVITTPQDKKMYASEYLGFSLTEIVDRLREEIEDGTNGTIKINITDTTRLEEFPTYNGYKSMTEKQFHLLFPYNNELQHGEWSGWWERDAEQSILEEGVDRFHFDYDYFIKKLDLVKQKNAGKFDMVWVYSIDPSSMYETCMVGRTAVYINGSPVIADCDNFLLAGLTFSRPDGAVESICHSCEAMLNYTYKITDEKYNSKFDFKDYDELSNWEKFYYNKSKGADGKTVYGVGQVHFSPNSEDNYEWENDTPVDSYYDQFTSAYPKIDPKKATKFTASSSYMNNARFSKYLSAGERHHVWWLSCMPHFTGRDSDGFLMNWFDYAFSTEYTSGISGLDEYKDNCIEMKIGDSLDKLKLRRFLNGTESGEVITADKEHAWVKVDGECIEYSSNGKVTAKSAGTANIEIKVDGFSLTYKVTVKKEELKAGTVIKKNNARYTVLSSSKLSYEGPIKKQSTVKIPDSITIDNKVYKVTAIKSKAFYKDKKLKKIVIGKNVNSIEKRAFKGCKNLKSVTIKSKKMSFGKESFKGINKKAVFKVPKTKKKEYKRNLIKKGKAPKTILFLS